MLERSRRLPPSSRCASGDLHTAHFGCILPAPFDHCCHLELSLWLRCLLSPRGYESACCFTWAPTGLAGLDVCQELAMRRLECPRKMGDLCYQNHETIGL